MSVIGKGVFINTYAEDHNMSKSQAEKEVNNFLDTLCNVLENEGGVCFKSVLTLEVVERKGRKGKIGDREYVSVDKNVVKAKTGSLLVGRLND